MYFARTASPGLIIGSSVSVSGIGAITVSGKDWTDITNDLGQSPVYYWTIGSANDDGKTLYANWRPISDRRATLLSPLDGVTLPASATTFTWDAGSGVQSYALWIGSEPGASDIYAGNEGTNQSRSMTLPTDGRPIYVRLWSMLDGALDQYFSYSFIAQKAASSTVKSQMVYPTNGSTFDSGAVGFAWDSGTGAQGYALWVGSSPGTHDLFSAGEGTKLAETVTVPTDGRPIYVRLWTMFNGVWQQYNSYAYTSRFIASEPAKLLTPYSGTTLVSSATTFTWDAGIKAEAYSLWVGSSPGASDLYAGNEGLNRSKTVNLPSDGRPIYVRLLTMFNGKWERFNSYNFTAPVAPTANIKAQMLAPANLSTLAGSSVTFTWNAGAGALEYMLDVGSQPGGSNFTHSSAGTSLGLSAGGLPTDGSPVYVRLWTRFASGWGSNYNDYTYTSQFVQPSEATMASPADRSTLPLGPTTFTWNPGGRAEQYVLWIGSSPGASDIYSSSEGLRLSKTLTLPSDGRPIYVKLWTMINGKLERSRSYIYTTSIAAAPAKAQLTSPANGSTLSSGTLDLQWTTATSAEKYALWVGTTPGGSDIYGADEGKTTARSLAVPTVGQKIYVRLWTLLGGTWGYNDYTFATPVAAGALARLTAPANGSALPAATTTFTWDAGTGAQAYSLWIGSSPNTNDVYSGVEGLNLSRTLALPTDGGPLFVQLWTMFNGAWSQSNYYSFTAFSPPSQIKAGLVAPAAGSLLPLGQTTFTWNSGAGATQYALWIGSTPDGNDLYAGTEGTNLSKTLDLPTDGRPIYVRLWSMFNGEWRQYNSYTFTTPIKPAPAKAQMLTPNNGTTLTSNTVTYTWNAGKGALEYMLDVGSQPGGSNFMHSSAGTLLSLPATGLPTNGSPVYVRLWTRFASGWGSNYNDYIYTAATVAVPTPTPTPAPTPTPTRVLALSGNLAFGNVNIGSSKTATLVVGNTGNTALTVSSITYPGGFSGNWAGGTIAPGSYQMVTVAFNPTSAVSSGGAVTVKANQTAGATSIQASGTGVTVPIRTLSLGGNLAFGNINVGSPKTAPMTISNTGNSVLTVTGITYPAGFSGNWTGGTIAPGALRTVTVTFNPTSATSTAGNVTVNANQTAGANTIAASGTGVMVPSRILSLGGNLAFGKVKIGSPKTAPMTISNTGNSALTVTSITYPAGFNGNWAGGTIAPGASQALTVTFNPTSATSLAGAVTVSANQTAGANTIAASGKGITGP